MRTKALLLTCLFITAAARAENKVSVTPVSSSATALPGAHLEVALRFQIPDGWHLYYTNPGDTGVPPKITWDLPPGVTAGELKFPTPKTIALPNNLTAYGYEHELTLLTTIDIDSQLDAERPIDLTGHVKWVVCSKDECLAEKQDVALAIAIGPVDSASAGTFTSWRADQPQRPTAQELPADVFIKPGAAQGVVAEGVVSVRMPADFDGESDFTIVPPHVDFLTFDKPAGRHAIVGGMMVTQPFTILPGEHPTTNAVLLIQYKSTGAGSAAGGSQKSVEVPLTFRFDRR